LSDREGVAIWIPESSDLGSTLELGDALLVYGYQSFVVALEGFALRGEFVNDRFNVVDVPAGQSCRRAPARDLVDEGIRCRLTR